MNTTTLVRATRGQRMGLPAGALVLALLWLTPVGAPFLAAWAALGAWILLRASATPTPRRPWLALGAMALAPLPLAFEGLPGGLVATCLALGAGAVPFHLWIEDARRSLRRTEFALLLIAQPGVALLHRWLEAHPHQLDAASVSALQLLLVVSAVAHSGLALVRDEQERAIASIALSQSALVLAGALGEEHGWMAARTMLVSLSIGSAVLLAILIELRRLHGTSRLSHRHALAEVEPALHAAFVACGWAFVGVPGGLAFFAEDLLFHELVRAAPVATILFVATTGFNAIAFYRVYLGTFCGTRRDGPASFAREEDASLNAPGRWLLLGLLLGTAALYVLGFLPMLVLGSH